MSQLRVPNVNKLAPISPAGVQILECGRAAGFRFQYLGRGPTITEVTWADDMTWVVGPTALDSTPIPEPGLQAIEFVNRLDARIAGYATLHETPKALKGSVEPIVEGEWRTLQKARRLAVWPIVKAIGSVALAVAGSVAVVVGIIALLYILLPALMVVGALLMIGFAAGVDPAIIAITEEGDYICLYAWKV